MTTNEPIKLADAKVWWVVYSSGLQRGRSITTAANFVYYNDACVWAEKKRRKGLCVEVKEERAVEWVDMV